MSDTLIWLLCGVHVLLLCAVVWVCITAPWEEKDE